MIIAIYKDDGPLAAGGQDIERTSSWEKAIPFPDYDAFRRADYLISEETEQRKNPRFIKWYEVESVIARAEVATALREALAAIAAIPISDYSTDGDAAELVRRDDAADIVRAAMEKLGITDQADSDNGKINGKI